jgi:hypothetical protein
MVPPHRPPGCAGDTGEEAGVPPADLGSSDRQGGSPSGAPPRRKGGTRGTLPSPASHREGGPARATGREVRRAAAAPVRPRRGQTSERGV